MNRQNLRSSIHRRYLHDEVAQRLRELIRVGELEPRARINELELTARFGISRTPLRRPSRSSPPRVFSSFCPIGVRDVASVSADEVEEMIEVIAGLGQPPQISPAGRSPIRKFGDREAKHHAMVAAWNETTIRPTSP